MDRSEINRALAKCIAYKNVGKPVDARVWFNRLTGLLGYSDQDLDDDTNCENVSNKMRI